MHPELTRQLGDRPVPSDRRQRHLRLEPRIMFLPCPLHILLPRYPRVLGAGLHLSQLSHFRGPPHSARLGLRPCDGGSEELSGILGGPSSFASRSAIRRVNSSICAVCASVSAISSSLDSLTRSS